MTTKKKQHPSEKSNLHPRNRHRQRYDFNKLIEACPELSLFVKLNAYDDLSIDFSDPQAVKILNKALLKLYYDIAHWDIPDNNLCPPIPGRADYIHSVADLLSLKNNAIIPTGPKIKCLDIGIGANCIYPIIGCREYGWSFVGSDIDSMSINSAHKIIAANPVLKNLIEVRLQPNIKDIFFDIIQPEERFDVSICNPPFHASLAEAEAGNRRKITNLKLKKTYTTMLNFNGKNNELWYIGGEKKFVQQMIFQSKKFATSCLWFTTLISKKTNLDSVYAALKKVHAVEIKTLAMGQGNKISRIVAWTFFSLEQQQQWIARWNH